jgi:hypothetical protein
MGKLGLSGTRVMERGEGREGISARSKLPQEQGVMSLNHFCILVHSFAL